MSEEIKGKEMIDERMKLLFTVSQFVERHSFVSNGGLRFQIFNARQNGLEEAGAILRMGRRILIDEKKYFAWIDSLQK